MTAAHIRFRSRSISATRRARPVVGGRADADGRHRGGRAAAARGGRHGGPAGGAGRAGGAVAPHPRPSLAPRTAAAYERGDYAAVNAALGRSTALANVIRDFRASDPPWPKAPRRTAVFALELAFGGLASGNGFARDEAMKLLAEYNAR